MREEKLEVSGWPVGVPVTDVEAELEQPWAQRGAERFREKVQLGKSRTCSCNGGEMPA